MDVQELKEDLYHIKSDIQSDLKEIKSDIKLIHSTLERNTASLIVHEARTTLAEKRIERFESGTKWVLGVIASGLVAILTRLLFR